jgi:NAD(P)-dependent dehydrogenase (short-subunit alcohol dehydrogenase family)
MKNPVLVVTGATKGIGRAIVDLFVGHGFDVAVCARTDADVTALAAALQAQMKPGQRFVARVCNVRDRASLRAFADAVLAELGTVDILVNNAGVFIPGTMQDEADDAFEMIMETNVFSAYHLSRALLPAMLTAQRGHIINICSVASIRAYPTGGSYSVSKFAMLGLSKGLREELKGRNIKVTALLPGAVWTDSWSSSGVAEERLMPAGDIARIVWDVAHLSANTVVEEMVIRPMLGDL